MHEEKEALKYVLETDKALIAQGTDWLREKYGAEYLYRAVRCYEIKLKEDAAESVQTTLKECNQKLNRYEDFEYSISNHSAWVKRKINTDSLTTMQMRLYLAPMIAYVLVKCAMDFGLSAKTANGDVLIKRVR